MKTLYARKRSTCDEEMMIVTPPSKKCHTVLEALELLVKDVPWEQICIGRVLDDGEGMQILEWLLAHPKYAPQFIIPERYANDSAFNPLDEVNFGILVGKIMKSKEVGIK